MADDTASFSYIPPGRNGSCGKLEIHWTSDSTGGTVSQSTGFDVCGAIQRIVTVPHATAPTANHDITIDDEDSVDVALGQLANRHTSNTESVYPSQVGHGALTDFLMVVAGPLTVSIVGAGNSKKGKIIIYLQ